MGRALSSCQSHTFHQDPHIHPTASGLTYLVIYSAFKIKSHHAERVWCQVPPREILAHPRWDDSATETRGVFLPQTVCKEGDGGISIFFFFSLFHNSSFHQNRFKPKVFKSEDSGHCNAHSIEGCPQFTGSPAAFPVRSLHFILIFVHPREFNVKTRCLCSLLCEAT